MIICTLLNAKILCTKSIALEVLDQNLELLAQEKAKNASFSWLAEKVNIITKSEDINATDNLGNTRLHYATFLENSEAINLLLRMGADITKLNNNGQDFLAILKVLIDKEKDQKRKNTLTTRYQQILRFIAQKDIHQRFQNGDTLLHRAVDVQESSLVIEFLKQIDPNTPNNLGLTSLHVAAAESLVYPALLNQLLTHGALPNLQTAAGNTPLHAAAMFFTGNPLTINKLLEYGASPDIQNNNGDTPIHKMLETLNELIKEYTQAKKARAILDEKLTIIQRAAQALFSLLNHAKNKNIQDDFGNTALYHLILLSATKEPEIYNVLNPLIELLTTSPATNPNIQNRDGFTALHAAVAQQNPQLVKLLLTQGANPLIRSYTQPRTIAQVKSGQVPPPDKTPRELAQAIKVALPLEQQLPLIEIENALYKKEQQLGQTQGQPRLQQERPESPAPLVIPQPMSHKSPTPPQTLTALEGAVADLMTALQQLQKIL